MRFTASGARKLGVLGSALLLASAAGLAGPRVTHAQWSVCHDDPYVYLSNGKVLEIAASISDSPADVKSVNYVLHGPANTYVTKITWTTQVSSSVNSLTYYADDAVSTYDGYTTVRTGTPNMSISAYMAIGKKTSTTVSGYSGATALHTHLVAS